MDDHRKQARDWLHSSTLTQYEEVTKEAKLTPKQKDILDKYILKGYTQQQIAYETFEDIASIKRALHTTYDKIFNALLK